MTERTDRVEPPLNRRSVQSFLVLLVLIACSFFALHFPDRPSPRLVPASRIELDLNSASEMELSLVPGIGPKLAHRIVANRERLGDFPTLESLDRVHGIGPRTIQRIATLCVVNQSSWNSPSSP